LLGMRTDRYGNRPHKTEDGDQDPQHY
jgi:hypothetical protein